MVLYTLTQYRPLREVRVGRHTVSGSRFPARMDALDSIGSIGIGLATSTFRQNHDFSEILENPLYLIIFVTQGGAVV